MEPKLIQLFDSTPQSISIHHYRHKRFPGIWHYHHEYEITYIVSSKGTRFVGDHIESFDAGELIVVGDNLPHTWKNDMATHKERKNASQALVVHFTKDCLGERFWDLPEIDPIKRFLQKARYGLKITGKAKKITVELMHKMISQQKGDRIITFLTILNTIASAPSVQSMASRGFMHALDNDNSDRINKVYKFIMENFKSDISLVKVAGVANMSPSAFSRFFSHSTKKSFSDFIIELKIGYACKLLSEYDRSVTDVCFACGFNNLSNFNKQFKKITRATPKKYQLKFKVSG